MLLLLPLVVILVFFLMLLFRADLVIKILGSDSVEKSIPKVSNLLKNVGVDVDDSRLKYRAFFDQNAGDLKGKPMAEYVLALGLSLTNFDHDAVWDYKKTPFWAKINSIDSSRSLVSLQFISPVSMPYLKQYKEVKIVDCDKSNSYLTINNPRSIQKDVDVYLSYSPGDELVSFCSNSDCTEIGVMCKLMRN